MEEIASNFYSFNSNNSINTFNISTLLDFFMCVFFSIILNYFYINNSKSLSGKLHIGSILPILSLIVFLVILIVKSSLALSLGLVGALSIVRFRTPIKEPEELIYLFLAIAIGLGYGAGQTLTTTSILTLIFIVSFIFLNFNKKNTHSEYNLIVSWKDKKIDHKNIYQKLENYSNSLKLIRFENNQENSQLVLLIQLKDKSNLSEIQTSLNEIYDNFDISFFEARNNW